MVLELSPLLEAVRAVYFALSSDVGASPKGFYFGSPSLGHGLGFPSGQETGYITGLTLLIPVSQESL